MRRHRRLAVVGLTAVAAVPAVLIPTSASADVPAPFFATDANASDPHIIQCTNPSTGVNGYCLYTSKDRGQEHAYPDGCETGAFKCLNYYPMDVTRVYFSPNGFDGWTSGGIAAWEAFQYQSSGGWIADGALHQWAPSAVKSGSEYFLFVPNVADKGDPGIHTSSRIGVYRSADAFDFRFDFQGTVTVHGYMSDPDVIIDGERRILLWADGDYSTCGGFKVAQLESDMMTTVSRSVSPITINGVEVLGSCDPDGAAGPIGRPYVEGASIYRTGNTFTMYFAAKPESTPKECATGVGGNNSTNSVIARATAPDYLGPWTYQGVVICGSSTEWTSQATVTTVSNGRQIIVYHDSPKDIKERKLHAECLFANPNHGIVGGVHRQAQNAANGFNDCMAGANFDFYGWHMRDPQFPNLPPIIRAPSNGTALAANRYAVGPWERYQMISMGNGAHAVKSLSNGKLLCTPNTSTAITASCSFGDPGTRWRLDTVGTAGTGRYRLFSLTHNRYLSVAGDSKLYASGTDTSAAAVLTVLYPGGKQ